VEVVRLHTFMEMAFRPHVGKELLAFQNDEHQKYKAAGAQSNPDESLARFMEELKRRLKPTDPGPWLPHAGQLRAVRQERALDPNTRPETAL
jgi:hypothetical protein